ncbi:MAG: BREX-3 system phosphatase PglZ [Candidatus Methanoperedens sp.]|nr:BREX-3 system phosphatase PglZ [Candidatus Methanoperedens sp.]
MDNWREYVLRDFQKNISKLTLVADPDGLLSEYEILTEIRNREFDLIQFKDHVSFRYSYEMNYRQCWDNGEEKDLVVVLHSDEATLDNLPYDLLTVGRKLSYKLSDIFPKLSNPIIQEVEKSDLDTLFTYYNGYSGAILSDNETIEFLLKNVYHLNLSIHILPRDLIKWLFFRHYRTNRDEKPIKPPEIIDIYIINKLLKISIFSNWPLSAIIPYKADFFAFLQQQWEIFLNGKSSIIVPFEEDDIRVYLDNFFLEGYLQPIKSINPNKRPEWINVGIIGPQSASKKKLEHIAASILEMRPSVLSSVNQWLDFSKMWAELMVLINEDDVEIPENIKEIYSKIEDDFEQWILQNFASIHNLSYLPIPKMVHHIAPYLASKKFSKETKIALIVLDGMSSDNWIIIKNKLSKMDKTLIFDENQVFSWIPTITTISRQSIFAGILPINFSSTIETTSAEYSLWKKFWMNEKGLTDQMVGYKSALDNNLIQNINDILNKPKLSVLGLVISKIDTIMHGMKVGIKGMHSNIEIWMRTGELSRFITELLDRGFQVFITSDHGNTEAKGIGEPSQGILVDEKYKRARIYSGDGGQNFREEAFNDFPESIKWPVGIGLPNDKYVLMPKAGRAYTDKGKTVVTHGGLSIEEIIVPFVEIRRREE